MKCRARLCALAAAFALLAGCIPQPTPPLHSKGEVLFELQKSYGIEFVLLSSEPYDDAFVVNGKHYVAAPADDPDSAAYPPIRYQYKPYRHKVHRMKG